MKELLMDICDELGIDEPYDQDGNLDPRIQAEYDRLVDEACGRS